MNIKCHVYQARNGLIYLSHGDGRVCSALILQQVNDLRLDLYSLDDFSLEDFKKAYSVPQSSQNVPAAVVTADEHLEQAIGAMLETGMIQFEPFSWCYRLVDMTVSSQVFTNKECVITVDEDSAPIYHKYSGEFETDDTWVAEEELIQWSLTNMCAPLPPDASKRYIDLFQQTFGVDVWGPAQV